MRRAAIVSPVRTAVGTFGGSLKSIPVETLGATVVKAVIERTGMRPELIEDVVFAQSYANSETPCVGRWIALSAGLPIEVPALQNRIEARLQDHGLSRFVDDHVLRIEPIDDAGDEFVVVDRELCEDCVDLLAEAA